MPFQIYIRNRLLPYAHILQIFIDWPTMSIECRRMSRFFASVRPDLVHRFCERLMRNPEPDAPEGGVLLIRSLSYRTCKPLSGSIM